MTHYDVLGVAADADAHSIKRAYFAKVKQHSPDTDPQGFRQIRDAYDVLRDRAKRQAYDNLAHDTQAELLLTLAPLLETHQYTQAQTLIEQALVNVPTHPRLLHMLARCWLYLGKTGKAENVCKELHAAHPDHVEGWILRGHIAKSRGHTNKAEAHFVQATTHAQDAATDLRGSAWAHRFSFVLEEMPWTLNALIDALLDTDPDAFAEQYEYYLHMLGHSLSARFAEANTNSRTLLEKFVHYYALDAVPSKECFEHSLALMPALLHQELLIPIATGPLYDLLCGSTWLTQAYQDQFEDMGIHILAKRFDTDPNIHDALADYLAISMGIESDMSLKEAEAMMVLTLAESRGSVKYLRDNFPEEFAKRAVFLNKLLDPAKEPQLQNQYDKTIKKFAKRAFQEMFGDEAEDFGLNAIPVKEQHLFGQMLFSPEDFEPAPFTVPQQPITKAPKVGRNDPCPCGSGRKYKHCCL